LLPTASFSARRRASNDGLALHHLGHLVQLLGKDQRLARRLGLQPCHRGQQGQALQAPFVLLCLHPGRVQQRQRLAGAHGLAFAHLQLAQDAAFQAGDDLLAAHRDHPALGPGDHVHLGQRRPHHRHHQGGQHQVHGPGGRMAGSFCCATCSGLR
jgi:hypothetical protein